MNVALLLTQKVLLNLKEAFGITVAATPLYKNLVSVSISTIHLTFNKRIRISQIAQLPRFRGDAMNIPKSVKVRRRW